MKLRVNLYTDEFRPKRQWLTLPQMALGWLAGAVPFTCC